jgi:predicted nucleotidyltransferase/peptidoglycan hydrolase-like protein with peptidoglycan-binding domain
MNKFNKIFDTLKVKPRLYPKFWEQDMTLKPDVRKKLLEIGQNFIEFLEMDAVIGDIVFMGSLASYNWSKYSDVDIHIMVDMSQFPEKQIELYKELFKLKKSLYKNKYDIKMFGHEVELYVQDEQEVNYSSGIYSLTHDEWVKEPKKEIMDVDKRLLKDKVEYWMRIIDDVIDQAEKEPASKIVNLFNKYKEKLKKYRKIGLDKNGEYSLENLVFKFLRRNGYIQKLIDFQKKFIEKKLSLRENISENIDTEVKKFWHPLRDMIKDKIELKKSGNGEINLNVSWVQAALSFLMSPRIKVNVNGKFDNDFEKVVNEFEKEYRLPQDGVLDEQDLKMLARILHEKSFSKSQFEKHLGGEATTNAEPNTIQIVSPSSDDDFFKSILKGIGAPETPENMRFLKAWRQAEGGKAKNNPFNTTYNLKDDKGMTIYNSHKVRNYSTPEYGIEATIKTITNPRYSCITDALKKGDNAMSVATCPSMKTWGTGDLVIKVLKGKTLNPPKIVN